MWYVYLLECFDKTLYCGITKNLDQRLEQHQAGKASKYTRSRLPVQILEFKQVKNQSEALKLENKIKKIERNKKIEFLKES